MTKQGRGLWALAFLVSVAFLPGVIDPAMSVRWAVLAIGPVLFLLYRHWVTNIHAMAYLAVVMVSVLWCPDLMDGLEELTHLWILAGCFLLGTVIEDIRPAWRGLAAGISVSAAIAVAQRLGFTGIDQLSPPSGLFMNRNMLAEAGMVAFIPMMMAGAWLWAIGPAVAVILGGSKAVFAALAVVAAMLSRGFARAAILLLASNAALLWAAFGNHASFDSRVFIWESISSNLAWFGHGLGSVSTALPYIEYPHSEYLGWVYEFGVLALVPLAFLHNIMRRVSYGPERVILAALCVVSVVAFPFHLPLTGFVAALAAGYLARHGVILRRPAAIPAAYFTSFHPAPAGYADGRVVGKSGPGRGDLAAGPAHAANAGQAAAVRGNSSLRT